MASRLYSIYNGAAPGAAQIAAQSTGTSICTLFEIASSATMTAEVIEWGISFDGSAAATPGKCELLVHTGGPTVTGFTNFVAADINKLSFSGNGLASGLTISSASTAWNPAHAGTQVTPTGPRLADGQQLPPTAPYIKQFPLERGPQMNFSEFLQVRVQFGTTVNALCYVVWQE